MHACQRDLHSSRFVNFGTRPPARLPIAETMKIFISSLIGGHEDLRNAAASAIAALGHEAVRAEDFGASPEAPQIACLAGVRAADALVLILGERYGHTQRSGLSATHEEYHEAREARPVLVFIQRGVQPEERQAAFMSEVQGWERGHFTAHFSDVTELRDRVIRGLHDYAMANESSPVDEGQILKQAEALIPASRATTGPAIVLAVAGGPRRAVLRPAELESEELRRFMLAEPPRRGCSSLTGTPTSGSQRR